MESDVLTARLDTLKRDRVDAERARDAARAELAQARLAGAGDADLKRVRKTLEEAERDVAELGAAIEQAALQIGARAASAEAEFRAELAARERDHRAALGNVVPDVVRHLEAAFTAIANVGPHDTSGERHRLLDEIERVVSSAVYEIKLGRGPMISARLDEWRHQRLGGAATSTTAEAPHHPTPCPDPAVVLYAKRPFRFEDDGRERRVEAGNLVLVVDDVAQRAVAAGVAEIVDRKPEVIRVVMRETCRSADGRVYAPGVEAVLPLADFTALPAGVANRLDRLTRAEVDRLRKTYPRRQSAAEPVDLDALPVRRQAGEASMKMGAAA